jgi:isoleucyl-tRNA synthetase
MRIRCVETETNLKIYKMSKYKAVDSNLDLVKIEKEILDYWKKQRIFEKVVAKYKDAPSWVYYDGPITANGLPHYGHACTWTMKDVLPRYWTMKGYKVPRNMGWDCQGILVEYEVEKALKFEDKNDIEEYGIAKFNDACRKSVLKFRDSMISYETRLGRWLSDEQYSTMDKDYIESMWWGIKQLKEKGLLYEGHKVVAYSTRAGMTLSSHEVADGGYKMIVDPAITVKFELKDTPNTYILAWTTTPYTIPGNLLVAIGKKITYSKVKVNKETYIVAKEAVERLFKGQKYSIVETVKGKDLVGLSYNQPFNYFENRRGQGAFKVVSADFVNTKEGTGVVHLAPYGEDDFVVLLEKGIKMFDYLDEVGHFNDLIPEYKGMFYKKANKYIVEDLKKSNLLFSDSDYEHSMPVSYRTKEPLIYKPIKSWYVDITKLKPRLLEEANKLNIKPEEMKKRFISWVEGARDWSLSRRRYWGTPMPIWVNDKTKETVFVGSFKELEELSGKNLGKDFDPHKPFVDEITWQGSKSGVFRRLPEVIDVWFDSGSMSYAQFHYPFENKDKFNENFPAEYISEADDQIRLWFYTLFVLGIALFDKPAFKNVAVIGMLGDEKGKKMSKSAGNYPPIEEVFEQYGSDMLRYFLLTGGIAGGQSTAFSYDILVETKKEIFTMLWNSYKYYITYASLFNFNGSSVSFSDDIMDQWVLSRLHELTRSIDKRLSSYEIMFAAREFSAFVQDLSTWYIRRSRDRLSVGDKEALNTLYTCLLTLSKLMAPFTPFLSDEIYLNLTRGELEDSVHLELYPKPLKTPLINKNLLLQMSRVREISSVGNALRKEVNIGVRQPLGELKVKGLKLQVSDELVDLIKDELNIKDVKFVKVLPKGKDWVSKEDIALNTHISKELQLEGLYRNLVREVQGLRKEKGLNVADTIEVTLQNNYTNKNIIDEYKKDFKEKVGAATITFGEDLKITKI